MPSLFPELFNFSFLAPFILRIALGVPLIKHGFGKIIAPQSALQRILGGIVFLSGIFLVIGLFIQAAAIVVSLIIIASSIIMRPKFLTSETSVEIGSTPVVRGQHPRSWTERLIKLAIAVSLILTGPGLFAFDLPL